MSTVDVVVWGIVAAIVSALLEAILERVVDQVIRPYERTRYWWQFGVRLVAVLAIVTSTLLLAARPLISFSTTSIDVTYPRQEGLRVNGDVVAYGRHSIYLLGRLAHGGDQDVWTVLRRVFNGSRARARWSARLPLHGIRGDINLGDVYEVLAIMTKASLNEGDRIAGPDVERITTAATDILEMKIREVRH